MTGRVAERAVSVADRVHHVERVVPGAAAGPVRPALPHVAVGLDVAQPVLEGGVARGVAADPELARIAAGAARAATRSPDASAPSRWSASCTPRCSPSRRGRGYWCSSNIHQSLGSRMAPANASALDGLPPHASNHVIAPDQLLPGTSRRFPAPFARMAAMARLAASIQTEVGMVWGSFMSPYTTAGSDGHSTASLAHRSASASTGTPGPPIGVGVVARAACSGRSCARR